ncbi:site-2 protease family protein [Candidatus Villigracilis affinis]|uniref:site-2 protease family protein n=1 Tax=Candidatus Villigracilis affinis TaxID=3140682 RepID=UPI0031E9A2D6
MKWQWKLGKFAGIDVYVHATFLLLIAWVGYSHWLENNNWGEVFSGILFILALFACVVLHEYGHALTARKYGIKTRDITLYPIGGVARLERMPEKPIEELWVALMGPAVNVVIAAGLFAYLYLTSSLVPLSELTMASGSFLERLMTVNITLVLFNLIPAFPMDGGRVLRALLAMRMDYVRATQIAASIGQGFGAVIRSGWVVWQCLAVVHCLLHLDRRFTGIKRNSNEERHQRNPSGPCNADRVQKPFAA